MVVVVVEEEREGGRALSGIWALLFRARRASRRGNWLGVVEKEARGVRVCEQACLDIHCPACRGAGGANDARARGCNLASEPGKAH